MTTRGHGFLRHAALIFASSMVTNAFNYGFHALNSRRLGVDGYGALSSLVAGVVLLSAPALIAQLIVTRYAAEFHALDERARLARFTQVVVGRALCLAAAVAVICVLGQRLLGAYLHVDNVAALTATGITIGVTIALPALRGILQGRQSFTALSISTSLEATAKLVVGVGLVYAGFGVDGALIGYTIGGVLALAYTVFALRTGDAPEPTPIHVDVRRLIQTTLAVALASISTTIFLSTDVLAVKHYFSDADAGAYAALALCGKILLFGVGFVATVVLPKATSARRSGGLRGLLLQSGVVAVTICTLGVLAYALEPALILRVVVGKAFVTQAALLPMYAVAMSLLGLMNAAAMFRIGAHRFEFVVPLSACAALELLGFAFLHRTLLDVIHVLLASSALALLATTWRIHLPERRPAVLVGEQAA
jgi:O-antigen/teichoic acid export membrane protein